MEYRKQTDGWVTFHEHWGLALLFAPFLLFLLMRQCVVGADWPALVFLSTLSFTLMLLGGVLIGIAKWPAYRSGRFFTFGLKSVPTSLTGYYRWGWRVFVVGVALTLCLVC